MTCNFRYYPPHWDGFESYEDWYNPGYNLTASDADILVAQAKNTSSAVVIPDDWPSIPPYAFAGLKVNELVIPSSVKIIGAFAFACAKINTLTIDNGVEDIREAAFNRNKIKNLSIPESVKQIGNSAFADNKINSDLNFSSNIISIGENAFYKNKISNISLSDGIQSIGKDAFSRNPVNGKEVVIPRSLEESGDIGWPDNPRLFASEIISDEEGYSTGIIEFHRLDAIFRDHIAHRKRSTYFMTKTKRNSNVTVYKNFYPGTLYENGQGYSWNLESEFQSLFLGTVKDDEIVGTFKSETFIGDTGSDEITGGDGADLFAFWHSPRKESAEYIYEFGKKNADRILDFNGDERDHIGIPFYPFFGKDYELWADNISKRLTLAHSKGKKEVKSSMKSDADFVYNTKNGGLYFNENGAENGWGDGGMFAILENSPPLNEKNFVILAH